MPEEPEKTFLLCKDKRREENRGEERGIGGTQSGNSSSKCFISCSVVQLQMGWEGKWEF